MNKKKLYESIMASVAKEVKKALNEGAGAGYTVTIDGLKVKSIKVASEYDLKGHDSIVRFEATLDKSIVEWKAIGYYDGVTSEGIYYNDWLAEEFGELQKTVEGGKISGYVYLDDVANAQSTDPWYKVTKKDIYDYIEDWLNEFSIEAPYGGGWVHVDLTDPMEFHDIEIQDSYHVSYVYIDTIEINAPEITKAINWYFENYLDFDKIFGE